MKESILAFFKDYRVILLIILLIGSIASISLFGIQQGLDLKGGAIIQIHLEQPVNPDTMSKVTTVLDKRLNIFGVKDVKVRASGDQDVVVEIAGVTPEQVANVVGTPGKFEAKIGNQTVLVGSDIVNVKPYQVEGNTWRVPFTISVDGANRFAQIARGKGGQPVDMYLDDKLVSSPILSPELANGVPSTDVEVSGTNQTKAAAETEAKIIQTVLQSGALPVKVSIAGISSVSAELGEQFKNGAIISRYSCTDSYINHYFGEIPHSQTGSAHNIYQLSRTYFNPGNSLPNKVEYRFSSNSRYNSSYRYRGG